MSDDQLRDDIDRGQRAAALLSDDLLTGAFNTLRVEYLKAWEATAVRDSDARERLWQAVQILGKVRSQLQSTVNDGRLAQAEVDRMARGAPMTPVAVA